MWWRGGGTLKIILKNTARCITRIKQSSDHSALPSKLNVTCESNLAVFPEESNYLQLLCHILLLYASFLIYAVFQAEVAK